MTPASRCVRPESSQIHLKFSWKVSSFIDELDLLADSQLHLDGQSTVVRLCTCNRDKKSKKEIGKKAEKVKDKKAEKQKDYKAKKQIGKKAEKEKDRKLRMRRKKMKKKE